MNALLVSIQCRLAALQAEIEGMKILNARRLSENLSEAYDEDSFQHMAQLMNALAEEAVEISHHES